MVLLNSLLHQKYLSKKTWHLKKRNQIPKKQGVIKKFVYITYSLKNCRISCSLIYLYRNLPSNSQPPNAKLLLLTYCAHDVSTSHLGIPKIFLTRFHKTNRDRNLAKVLRDKYFRKKATSTQLMKDFHDKARPISYPKEKSWEMNLIAV